MASVIVSILRKKGRTPPEERRTQVDRYPLLKSNSFKTFRPGGLRAKIQADFSSSFVEVTKEDLAANTIQKIARGYLERKQLKRLWRQNTISWDSLISALEIIAQWHIGWTRCLLQSLFTILLIVTVCFQAFYYLPSAYDVNSALIRRIYANEVTVKRPSDFYTFLEAHIDNFYETDITDSSFCNDLLDTYCHLTNTNSDSMNIEQMLVQNCTKAFLNGYVDHSNRIIGTSFVTQTRKSTTRCDADFDTFQGAFTLSSATNRFCTDEYEEDSMFNSDNCDVNALNQSCTIRNQIDAFEFRPNPDGFFMFAFSSHLVRGLPKQALNCRISQLKELEWLDYRTKKACVVIGLVTKQGVGRVLLVKECFLFLMGGRVERVNSVSSASNFSDPTIAVAMTYSLMIIKVARNAIEFVLFWQERKAMRTKAQPRITCSELLREFFTRFFSFLSPFLVLVACGIYLGLVYTSQGLSKKLKVSSLESLLGTINEADATVQLWVAYTTVMSLAILAVLGRTLSLLDFHPTSAIVSGTLRRASVGLLHFSCIFTIVVLMYAFVGMLLLGRSRDEFSNFGQALNTLLFVAIGEVQIVQEIIFYTTVDANYVTVIQALYFWSYVILVTIILMNLLLSIIVGAFVELQEINGKSVGGRPMHSFGRSFGTSVRFWGQGTYIYCKRATARCCYKRKPVPDSVSNPNDEIQTPWEELVDYAQAFYNFQKEESTLIVRKHLKQIFRNDQSVELIIAWCRLYSTNEKMKRYEYNLQGLDPDSDVVKGRTLYLLQSVIERLHPRGKAASMKFKSVEVEEIV
jgi:hypothetical protein